MNKLTGAESQRMIVVLEEAIEHLNFLSYLTPSISDRSLNSVDPAVVEALQAHHGLESSYSQSVKAYNSGASSDAELSEASERLRRSTRRVGRLLGDPSVEAILQVASDGSTAGSREFVSKLQELGQLTLDKLGTTVEADQNRDETMKDLETKIKQGDDERHTLQMELRRETADKEKAMTYHNDIISKLRAELAEIEQQTSDDAASLQSESKEREETSRVSYEQKMAQCNAELAKLEEAVEKELNDHNSQEQEMRKKKNKLEIEVTEIVTKYDEDVGEKGKAIKALREDHEAMKAELAELGEYFRKVDRDLALEKEENRERADKKARSNAAQSALDDAATKIQATYRGKMERETVKKKKKKGKK